MSTQSSLDPETVGRLLAAAVEPVTPSPDALPAIRAGVGRRSRARFHRAAVGLFVTCGALAAVVGVHLAEGSTATPLTASPGQPTGASGMDLLPCAVVDNFTPGNGPNAIVTPVLAAKAGEMGRVLCQRLGGGGDVEQIEEWVSIGGLSGSGQGLTYDIQSQLPSMGDGSPTDQGDVWITVTRAGATSSGSGPPHVSLLTGGHVLEAQWPDGTLVRLDAGHDTALNRAIISDPAFDAFAVEGGMASSAAPAPSSGTNG